MSMMDEMGDVFALRREQFTESVTVLESTPGSGGLYDEGSTWSEVDTVKALVLMESGREKVSAGRPASDPAGTIEIDYREDVTDKHRIRYRGTDYLITNTHNVKQADEILELTVSAP